MLERLDQPAEAVLLLEEALRYPGLPQEVRSQAKLRSINSLRRLRPDRAQAQLPMRRLLYLRQEERIFATTLVCNRAPVSESLMRAFETENPAPNP